MSLTPRLDKLEKNYIINGNFDFWQRGTSSTPAGNTYLADRWQNHSGVNSYSRQAGGPDALSTYFARASGPSGLIGLGQKIESVFSKYITSETLTFSFWVKTTAGTPTISVQVRTPNAIDTYTSDTLIYNTVVATASTSWQRIIHNIPVTSTMRSNGFMASVAVVGAAVSTTIDLAQVMIIDGTQPAPKFSLASRTYSEELMLCQRYFNLIPRSVKGSRYGGGAGNSVDAIYEFPVTMRTTPTFVNISNPTVPTSGGPGANQVATLSYAPGGYVTSVSATISGGGDNRVGLWSIVFSSIGNINSGAFAITQLGASVIIGYDAEL